MPRSVLEQIQEHLGRLEVLEALETMRQAQKGKQ